nr:MAG TPA: hypothetical protein [Caudoviricetes sp.]
MRKYIFGSKIDCDTFIQKFNEFQNDSKFKNKISKITRIDTKTVLISIKNSNDIIIKKESFISPKEVDGLNSFLLESDDLASVSYESQLWKKHQIIEEYYHHPELKHCFLVLKFFSDNTRTKFVEDYKNWRNTEFGVNSNFNILDKNGLIYCMPSNRDFSRPCKKILVTGIDKDHHFGDDDFLSIHIYLNMLLGLIIK